MAFDQAFEQDQELVGYCSEWDTQKTFTLFKKNELVSIYLSVVSNKAPYRRLGNKKTYLVIESDTFQGRSTEELLQFASVEKPDAPSPVRQKDPVIVSTRSASPGPISNPASKRKEPDLSHDPLKLSGLEIGLRLKFYRQQAGLSQPAFGLRMGLGDLVKNGQSRVSKWESGSLEMTDQELTLAAEILGVDYKTLCLNQD